MSFWRKEKVAGSRHTKGCGGTTAGVIGRGSSLVRSAKVITTQVVKRMAHHLNCESLKGNKSITTIRFGKLEIPGGAVFSSYHSGPCPRLIALLVEQNPLVRDDT